MDHDLAGDRGDAMRAVIRESGLTQAWWATRLGVTESTISNWLSERHEPKEAPAAAALRAARELDLSPEVTKALAATVSAASQLAGTGEGDPTPPYTAPEHHRGLAALGRRLDMLRTSDRERYDELIDALVYQVEAHRMGNDAARTTVEFIKAWGRIEQPEVSGQLLADLEELCDRARLAAASGELDVWVHRDRSFVTSFFTDLTRLLEPGHRYHTVSNLDFWSSHNLHGRRDFLESQDNAVRVGKLSIRRLFLVPSDRVLTPDERAQLEVHLAATGIEARVLPVRSDEIPEIGNYVLTGPPERFTSLYTLRFRNLPDSGVRELDRVTLTTNPKEVARRAHSFSGLFEKGAELGTFVAELLGKGPDEF